MVLPDGTIMKNDSAVQEIANTLGEVTGKEPSEILSEMASNPTRDLLIPSPQAVAVLGKLMAKYGFQVRRQEIVKTRRGTFCSVRLLADLIRNKIE